MLWVEMGLMIQYPFVSPYRINLRYISTNTWIIVIFLGNSSDNLWSRFAVGVIFQREKLSLMLAVDGDDLHFFFFHIDTFDSVYRESKQDVP